MRRPTSGEIRNALGIVLFNANNHPVPHAVLGRDFSKLQNESTKAIEQLLDQMEGAEETITIAQAREVVRMAKEQAWDDAVAMFITRGWVVPSKKVRKMARKQMYEANPYRDIIQTDEAVLDVLSGAGGQA